MTTTKNKIAFKDYIAKCRDVLNNSAIDELNYEETEWHRLYKIRDTYEPKNYHYHMRRQEPVLEEMKKLLLKNSDYVYHDEAPRTSGVLKSVAHCLQSFYHLTHKDECGFPKTPDDVILGDCRKYANHSGLAKMRQLMSILFCTFIRMNKEMREFHDVSTERYNAYKDEQLLRDRATRNERASSKKLCEHCGKEVSYGGFSKHLQTNKCIEIRNKKECGLGV